MNIIYINHYAGSTKMGMAFRPYYLAREWQKMGHKVLVVASDYAHGRIHNPKNVSDFEVTDHEGVPYLWIHTRKYHGNGVKRALSVFQFCGKLWLKAGKIAREFKPDVVISASTYQLDFYPASRIAKKAKAMKVHEAHDMWPLTPIDRGMSKNNPFIWAVQMAENAFCKKADRVYSLLNGSKPYFVEHGMDPDKYRLAPNGIVVEDWANPLPLPELHQKTIDKIRSEGKKIISFYGSVNDDQCLEILLEAVGRCADKGLCVLYVGEGRFKQELIERSKSLPEGCAYFLPAISKLAIPSLVASIDASFNGLRRSPLYVHGVSLNKTYDGMMGGKPIIYAVEAPGNLIEQFDCGITVEPENVNALTEALLKFLSLSDEECERMGKNGQRAVVENFSYSVIAKRFLEGLE